LWKARVAAVIIARVATTTLSSSWASSAQLAGF